MIKIFFDTEFTGLYQNTTLISIGCVSENGREFYAEFTDYDKSQVDDWIQDNVINNLIYKQGKNWAYTDGAHVGREGDTDYISQELKIWLSEFDSVEMWSDCLSYDWVLFNALLADYSEGYPQLPRNVYYIPFDICTLFKIRQINPDINREEFSELTKGNQKHNALWDARVIMACYNRLIENRFVHHD